MQDRELFDRALKEISANPSVSTNHVQITRRLMEFAMNNGMTLQQCADYRFMNRAMRTLKRYARRFGMVFPDYTPRKLKPKKEPKEKS